MAGFNIPTIGTQVVLTKPWTFSVANESRNSTLVEKMTGIKLKCYWPWGQDEKEVLRRMHVGYDHATGQHKFEERPYTERKPKPGQDLTLPKGTILTVDRIYIRGKGDDYRKFDSVSFFAKLPDDEGKRRHFSKVKSSCRFFASLSDVNKAHIKPYVPPQLHP